jgi:hypothetical protein
VKKQIVAQRTIEKRTRQIEQIQKQLNMPIKLSKSITDAIEKLNKETAIISTKIITPVRDLTLYSQRILKKMEEASAIYTKSLMEMARRAQIVAEQVKQITDSPNYIEFYENYGWLDWLPAGSFLKLYVEYQKGKFSFLDNFNQWLSNQEQSKIILKRTLIPKVIIRRQRYIKNIFALHRKGNWTSSIPLALIQIEGVIRDLGVLIGYLENKVNPEYLLGQPRQKASFREIIIALFGKTKKIKRMTITQPLKKLLTDKIYTSDIRHSILHGTNLNYEDPIFSAHLIAILFSLSKKASTVETASHVKPYWEGK